MVIRNRYLLLADLLLIAAVPILSFTVRLDMLRFQRYYRACLLFILASLVLKPLIFYLFGLYRRLWRYASVEEALSVAWAVSLSSVVLAALVFGLLLPFGVIDRFPRSVVIIDWLLTLLLIGGVRFSFRLFPPRRSTQKGRALRQPPQAHSRVLIIGAGDAGAMLLREMQANPGLGLLPVGFIDDDPAKLSMRIHNVPVVGTREAIPEVARDGDVDEAIIAMPTVSGQVIRDIMAICGAADVPFRTVPGIYELLDGTVSVRQIREIGLEDLLRREPVSIDLDAVCGYLAGARVLVTGAGGSIGSELCHQIAIHGPEMLILVDHCENSVYDIRLELRERFPGLPVQPVIADVRNERRIEGVWSAHRPTVVFHAAAHKHVPLMECNLAEAITNNVVGTRNVARLAAAHGVERFVLISTDKAVNPVSVMGATKRVAELLVQDMARRDGAVFVTVRFGNVLGSQGSVVPLFQRQITAGGPVTVTHPEAERFFMTIPEAVQLVIQAAAMGEGGEIFVLDMEEQVKVLDLAHDLIRLSGLEPGRDIEVVFTELRPGEKLSEQLFAAWEEPRPTPHHAILVIEPRDDPARDRLDDDIAELERLAYGTDAERIVAKLREVVPEFRPAPAAKG
ncbi:MAG: nucleoside-diphosphate sugar epimerase/dehydratase [Anaerolineae bacterium]|jgi:FlaA1/EpsC-like NDP-sugar epimerase